MNGNSDFGIPTRGFVIVPSDCQLNALRAHACMSQRTEREEGPRVSVIGPKQLQEWSARGRMLDSSGMPSLLPVSLEAHAPHWQDSLFWLSQE